MPASDLPVARENYSHIAFRASVRQRDLAAGAPAESAHVVLLEPNVDFDDPSVRGWRYEDFAFYDGRAPIGTGIGGADRYVSVASGVIDCAFPSEDDVRSALMKPSDLDDAAPIPVEEVDWERAREAVSNALPVPPADLPTPEEAEGERETGRGIPLDRREYRYEGKSRPAFLARDAVAYIVPEEAAQDSAWWESHKYTEDDGTEFWNIDEIYDAGPEVTGAWTGLDFLDLADNEPAIAATVFEELDPGDELASDPEEIYEGLMGEEFETGALDFLEDSLEDIARIAREDSLAFDPSTLAIISGNVPSRANFDGWYRATARVKAVKRILQIQEDALLDSFRAQVDQLEEDINYSQDLSDSHAMAESERNLSEALASLGAVTRNDGWREIDRRLDALDSAMRSQEAREGSYVPVNLVDAVIRWSDTHEVEHVTFSDLSTEGLEIDDDVFMSGYTREDLEAARRGEIDLGEDFAVVNVLDDYRAYGRREASRAREEKDERPRREGDAASRAVVYSAAVYAAAQGLEQAYRALAPDERPATFEEYASALAREDLETEVEDIDARFESVLPGGHVAPMSDEWGLDGRPWLMTAPGETFREALGHFAEGDLDRIAVIDDDAGELTVRLDDGRSASFRKTRAADAEAARAAYERKSAAAGVIWRDRSAKPGFSRYGDVMNSKGWLDEPRAAWSWGAKGGDEDAAPWARLATSGGATGIGFAASVSECEDMIEYWEVEVALTDAEGNRRVVLQRGALTLAEAIAVAENAAIEYGFTPETCDRGAVDEAFLPARSLEKFTGRAEEGCGLRLDREAIEADLWASSRDGDDFEAARESTVDGIVDRLGTLVPYATYEKHVLGHDVAKLACRPVSPSAELSSRLSADVLSNLPSGPGAEGTGSLSVFRVSDPHALYEHMRSEDMLGTTFVYGDLAYVYCSDSFELPVEPDAIDEEWVAFKLNRDPASDGSWQRLCCFSMPDSEGPFLRDLGQMQLSRAPESVSLEGWRIVDMALGEMLPRLPVELTEEGGRAFEVIAHNPRIRTPAIAVALADASEEFADCQERGLPYDPAGLVGDLASLAEDYRTCQGAPPDPVQSRAIGTALYNLYMAPIASEGRRRILESQIRRGALASWTPEPPRDGDLASLRRWTCRESVAGRDVAITLSESGGMATVTATEGMLFQGRVETATIAQDVPLGRAILAAEGALARAKRESLFAAVAGAAAMAAPTRRVARSASRDLGISAPRPEARR